MRRFKPDPLPDGLLEKLLNLANNAPSGYNLQPWHFLVVTDEAKKKQLQVAALNQRQVAEAPAVVVFCGDTMAWKTHREEMIKMAIDAGAFTPDSARQSRKNIWKGLSIGPLGLLGLAKAIILPIRRLFIPTPQIPTTYAGLRAYAAKHTMLAAQTFMIAARAYGLDTCPMEGFDEARIKRIFGVPRRMVIPVIVAVGYGVEDLPPKQPRLPLSMKLHLNQWTTS